jgi:hypothetical protein
MVSIVEERKACAEAQAVISSLVRTLPIRLMRHDAAMALNVLCGAPLTHTTIETAKRVVEEWLH